MGLCFSEFFSLGTPKGARSDFNHQIFLFQTLLLAGELFDKLLLPSIAGCDLLAMG